MLSGAGSAILPTTVPPSAVQPSKQSGAERLLTVAEMRTDLRVLRQALAEAHGGYDRFASRAVVNARLAAYESSIRAPRSHQQFMPVVANAVASMQDGHLRLEYDPETNYALANAHIFPLRVALEGPRLVVVANDARENATPRPGMEIERINGMLAADIVQKLLPLVSGDGYIETGRRIRLGREFASLYWLYLSRAEQFDVVARDTGGARVSARVAGVLERDRRQVENAVNARYAANAKGLDSTTGLIGVQFLAGDSVARLRIRGFDGEKFPATLDSAFQRIRERGISRVVLDLRGNGGGVDEFGALLVGHFVASPFRYFDRIHLPSIAPHFATWTDRTLVSLREGTVADPRGGYLVTPKYHTGVGEQQPAAAPFSGQLVTLIDGGTFSTAADVAAQLRSLRRSTFVGEETGGGYEGNTSALNAQVVLPYSGLRLKIMMYDYWSAVTPPVERGRGVIPEDRTMTRVADILRGEDPALASALRMLGVSRER
jgi:hypothetical protein